MTKGRISVVGLGYVGLPVAAKFAEAGFSVVGIDVLPERVSLINAGQSPIEGEEPGLQALIERVVASGSLRASTDYTSIKDSDYVLIVVQTPFDLRRREPFYEALRSATASVGKNLAEGTLVVVESTVAPGTVDTIVKPILEEHSGLECGKDFMLAVAPERVMPGKLLYNLANLDRVIGGETEESTMKAIELYKHIGSGKLFPTTSLTAEVVKTTENAYRDVQIAFANEIALLCENIGVDVHEVRELVNKSPNRDMHIPGAGVGGHCIPKDSWLLLFGSRGKYEPKLISIAREINDGMPRHMSELCEVALSRAGRRPYGSIITILGFAYLENSADTRNSPAYLLIKSLETLGAIPVVHDPYVKEANDIQILQDIEKAAEGSDCIVVVTAHDEYRELNLKRLKSLMRTPIIVDGRNVVSRQEAIDNGFSYLGLGRGK
ncbi:MAG: nucleotide sugar dehydrogenase [Promethearchaeota archaeon]